MSDDIVLEQRFAQPDKWRWHIMRNARGHGLRYGCLMPENKPKAHVIYIEGLSEYAEKTFETARDVHENGCAFWVLDRQGQGLSGRQLKNIFNSHSTGFAHDVADLVQLAETLVADGAPIILLGHSTGALITLMALHDRPDLFAGATIGSPLLGLKDERLTGRENLFAKLPLPDFIRNRSVVGMDTWVERACKNLKAGDFSSDPSRMMIHDYWMNRQEKLRMEGASYGWLQAVCRAIAMVTKPSYLRSIEKPVHIFAAGHEYLINNSAVFAAYRHLPHATYHYMAKGRHELLMETDAIRAPVLRSVFSMAPV